MSNYTYVKAQKEQEFEEETREHREQIELLKA